jgi:hypothetical protein
MPHPYPLARSAGLFLVIAAIAALAGAVWTRRRWPLLAAGGAIGSVALALTAVPWSRPLGAPTRPQLASLLLAVFLEVVGIVWCQRRLRHLDERTRVLAVLAVVGAHFLPMGVAFGPWIVALGLAATANAVGGLLLFRRAALRTLWALDGALKLAAGVALLLGPGS